MRNLRSRFCSQVLLPKFTELKQNLTLYFCSTTAKEHYRALHTEEKPYKCPVCRQSFSISKILYKHVRVKHPDYFPQFKKEQNLTPNMKKAINKIRNGIKCEDDNIKVEFDLDEGKFKLVVLIGVLVNFVSFQATKTQLQYQNWMKKLRQFQK